MGAVADARLPRTFFDVRALISNYSAGGFHTLPGRLAERRDRDGMLLDEGLENVFARHRRMSVRRAVDAWEPSLCDAAGFYSDTVSFIRVRTV